MSEFKVGDKIVIKKGVVYEFYKPDMKGLVVNIDEGQPLVSFDDGKTTEWDGRRCVHVYTHHMELVKEETTPKNFKVGDRVRINQKCNFGHYEVGDTAVLTVDFTNNKVEPHFEAVVDGTGKTTWINLTEMEKIEEQSPTKLKRKDIVVGSKVKIRKNAKQYENEAGIFDDEVVGWNDSMDNFIGETAFVVKIVKRNQDWIYLDIDNQDWVWHRKMLKHIALPE